MSATQHVAERIQKELALPFNVSGREVFTTTSIGIAFKYNELSPARRHSPGMLTQLMYRAKSLGKARHEIFDPVMRGV